MSSSMPSSPTRSSSPPVTPCSLRQKYRIAYIHSSPPPPFDIHAHAHPMSQESVISSRYRQSYASGSTLYSCECESSPFATDDGEESGYSFAAESPRSTFFTISAERGRWKTDPMPRKLQSQPRICKSEPTPSRFPSLSSSSEPASGYDPQPEEMPSCESELETPVSDFADTLPSLASDRESSVGLDPLLTPLSPLPPSSPPLSPLSSPLSSPLLLSSPLSSPFSDKLSLEEEPVMVSERSEQKRLFV